MTRHLRGGRGVLAGAVLVLGLAVGAGRATASPAPVPRNFHATSITWISALHGWVLGAAPCGDTHCTYVLTTYDRGKTWQRLGRIRTPVAHIGDPDKPGVTEIRFATAQVGYAFAPYLFHTTDGGRTWTRMTIPGGDKQVFDLAANRTRAFALTSACRWMDFTQTCRTQLKAWHTNRLAGTGWSRISMKLPFSTRGDVAVHGRAVYVVDPRADLGQPDRFYASTDHGQHFAARKVPCVARLGIALVQAVPTSATDVALLCVGNPGFSKAEKSVYTSTDAARTDHFAGMTGEFGYRSQLAVSPTGNLAVASESDGSFIYINNTHGGTKWTMVWASSDGGAGWNDIGYTDNRTAWVIRGPLGGPSFSERGRLYVTHDAGKDWHVHSLRSA